VAAAPDGDELTRATRAWASAAITSAASTHRAISAGLRSIIAW
jgi:hypothetical protein